MPDTALWSRNETLLPTVDLTMTATQNKNLSYSFSRFLVR